MDISIIVRTRNRARALARTLEAFGRLRIPPSVSWEVVVVDNGSEDDTVELARDAGARFLPVRCVSQPLAGLSNARNGGVAAALGAIHLFTDDDIVTDPGWLAAYYAAAASAPHAAIFGGPSRERQTEAYILQFYTANGEEYPVPVEGVAATWIGLALGLGLRRLRYLADRALQRPVWVNNLVAYARFSGTVMARLNEA